ncbi:MAG: hypothetical protein M0T73_05370 [Deltaproteobacteria bacterium]|nr:hypothetical protein [Deltaproteobacteria bacterium]
MKFTVTIDVEEEGLFSGVYSPGEASAVNVLELDRLDPLFMDLGVRPTLLVSYQVANKSDILGKLYSLKKRWKAEIGAHLHHWNTPPIVLNEAPPPVPSELMPAYVLEAKALSLIKILSNSDGLPSSFRMGRFNLGPKMLQVLEKIGVKVDSSVTPLRKAYGGPNHICAPADPYFPDLLDPSRVGSSSILEVPVTIVPIFKGTGRYIEFLSSRGYLPDGMAGWLSMNLGSIAAQPAWVNLQIAKAAVITHERRGGDCVTIFFHSSELAPGMNPLNPTEDAVRKFTKRLHSFIRWMRDRYDAKCHTLSELYRIYEPIRTPPL